MRIRQKEDDSTTQEQHRTASSRSHHRHHPKQRQQSSSSSPLFCATDTTTTTTTANKNHKADKRKRNRIKYMFLEAKALERQGKWTDALQMFHKILNMDPYDAHSHLALARLEARRESSSSLSSLSLSSRRRSSGINNKHGQQQHDAQEEPNDNEQTATANATVEATKAQVAFQRGTKACPDSVHLWQSWALYEYQSRGNVERARQLFEEALALEPHNPYVCHAYSLMEKKNASAASAAAAATTTTNGEEDRAMALLQRGLQNKTQITAALVCSLGETFMERGQHDEARSLYQRELPRIRGEKDLVEVYLAAAWLEERHFQNLDTAQALLQEALKIAPSSSLASVALARLEGRMIQQRQQEIAGSNAATTNSNTHQKQQQQQQHQPRAIARPATSREVANQATAQRLAQACDEVEKQMMEASDHRSRSKTKTFTATNTDGRVFNALASLEIKQRRFDAARNVLKRGMDLFPSDHNLFTAAGKVEERVGNFTGARDLYVGSLRLEPSSPTLVAVALLELKNPFYSAVQSSAGTTQHNTVKRTNYTTIKGLFEKALLLDPRNGPAYNAYGNVEAQLGDIDEARSIFERGIRAGCSDSASIYHGFGMLELSCGNVERARTVLAEGLESARQRDVLSTDSPLRDRTRFLSHTLGMLELNSNRPSEALAIFEEGIQRCGNSSRLLLGAALCEMRLGKESAARSLFEQTIAADKKHAQAWQTWGVMETRAGNFKRASIIFEQGIKHVPQHADLWHGYATLEAKRGNVMNARTLFAAGLKKSSQRTHSLFQGWATLELRQGNYQAARKLISEALTKNKRNGRGWIIAAEIEEEDGNVGLVSLLLRRGIECAPGNVELYRKLGEYLVGQGKINDAREVFETGMELNPMYAPLYHSLAELEARIGNLDALSRLNKKAAELFHSNALESAPLPVSNSAFSSKITAGRTGNPPSSTSFGSSSSTTRTAPFVSVLAHRVGSDANDDTNDLSHVIGEDVDPMSTLEGLSQRNIIMDEDSLVGDLMSVEALDGNSTSY